MLTKLKFYSGGKNKLISMKSVKNIQQNIGVMKSLKQPLKNMSMRLKFLFCKYEKLRKNFS